MLLDGSASMSYDGRWDRARAAANDVLDDLGAEDRAQVVLAGRLFEVLGPATADVAALRQTLNTAEPGVFRLEYGQLMRSIDGLIRTAELPVVLDLVTDVQATGLPTPSSTRRASFVLRTSSGSFAQTRLPTEAVVETTGGMGTTTLVTMEPAASILPMSTSAL